ncbi:unnamed protein product [Ilex paraguariensis]|uniref:Uncharacterized protein n=1 Tax=Ilex paraguariensis TaxID=185542 RepID=A0ABC8S925_9AQUA
MNTASSSLCSSILPPLSFSPSSLQHPKMRFRRLKRSSGQFVACGRGSNGWDYRGLLVDESMIVLRKRIHEMKVMERNYEPPAEWMELEKQYYVCYDEFVCKFVGFLQTQLMNTRPSMALGMLVIITISVPTSALVIVARLIEAAHGVLPGFHLS